MKIAKQSLLFSSGFAGGFVAGVIVSAMKDTEPFRNQARRAERTIFRISQVLKEKNERFRELNQRLKKEFSNPIPDLYRATESLSLDEEELMYD